MIAVGALAKAWLSAVALSALQGTLLAFAALAVARIVRRPAWCAALWLVVVARLALPWGPALPWSLSDLIAMWTSSPSVPAAPLLPAALQPSPPPPSVWPSIGWLALASCWLIGASLVVVRGGRAHLATVRAANVAPDAPAPARARLAELARQLGVRTPRLAVGDAALGPHVVGLVWPTIVVPPALLADDALLAAALLHELAHVRRRDALGRTLQLVACAVLWWWPVARLAGRRLDAAREAACDAWALEAGALPAPAYARLLVQMAQLSAAAAPAFAAPHALDARIAAVLGPPARARLGALHRVALAAWIALALGGAREVEARPQVCHYSPELAFALYLAHPEADLDGDGALSRDEACQFQNEMRQVAGELASHLDPEAEAELETLLSEPLCCNSDQAGAYSSAEGACR
jgi:beta-lactamase regulating signal transducer with metallopeptidase domain